MHPPRRTTKKTNQLMNLYIPILVFIGAVCVSRRCDSPLHLKKKNFFLFGDLSKKVLEMSKDPVSAKANAVDRTFCYTPVFHTFGNRKT